MEEEIKCNCVEGEECTCGDNCNCGDDCTCGCHCGDECDCGHELPPLEEKLVLVGTKDDEETKEAMKYLDELKVDYTFLDLDNKDEMFDNLDFSDVKVPSLLLVQTVVSGLAPGIESIKEVFGE